MKYTADGQRVYSPSDLIRYVGSPFASWMDRYYLDNPDTVTPDDDTEEERLIAQTGCAHEQTVLAALKTEPAGVVEIQTTHVTMARAHTLAALLAQSPVIYQATLHCGPFAGFADFLIRNADGRYQVWDTKLARAPKPYYAIQLCCYAEMLADIPGVSVSDRFGLILGTNERVEFRLEDFVHYYRHIKQSFLAMHEQFTGRLSDRPEPRPHAEHRHWTSQAEQFFRERDHLVQVAGVTVGQIKKLQKAGITTMAQLAQASGRTIQRLNRDTLEHLAAQARLQCATRTERLQHATAPPQYEVLPHLGPNGEPIGLAALPPDDPADIFFDMEGYPLAPGGLEYLFGVCQWNRHTHAYKFRDWWAHDRDQEKRAFEGFVDWVMAVWTRHPGLHIYHYAHYEVSAVRRLSTQHDTRQNEVDTLLRHHVFVDLYQIVRHGVRIGADSYALKSIEHLYRGARATAVATAADSIVHYSHWLARNESGDWHESPILHAIRQYNEEDCQSTAQLAHWVRTVARQHTIAPLGVPPPAPEESQELPPAVLARQDIIAQLRQRGDDVAIVLADVVDFHRREAKPMWWRLFDRAAATPEDQRDDPGCLEGLTAQGACLAEKRSRVQAYRFDPSQECKLAQEDTVLFTHHLDATFTIAAIDIAAGSLTLKIGTKALEDKYHGVFPTQGALLAYEFVSPAGIPDALAAVAAEHLSGQLHAPIAALLARRPPAVSMQTAGESTVDAALRVARAMSGDCLVMQGPPGTGKTFAAARVITALLAQHKTIGISSNSHKVIVNLLRACGDAARQSGTSLQGLKVGGSADAAFVASNPDVHHVAHSGDARERYTGGVVGGTAWLFSRPEWAGVLDYLFIDEAGQVVLAHAVAMARAAKNLVLLGDQMQLEQPIQGVHPGDAGLSVLQYALKDTQASGPDAPVFHAVVPREAGLFLGESHRMHPSICRFVSESIYEGRLVSHPDCGRQRIGLASGKACAITQEDGVVFSPVEHDGNIQRSEEEVARVQLLYDALRGRPYTSKAGLIRPLGLEDFLFIAPYNAQVQALQHALPHGARVGSVDKFQGQEAPVCILSLGSSYGEYGARGLAFLLNQHRINVAISRAQCMTIVVADPRIAESRPASLDDMTLLNLFCKLATPSTTD